MFDNALRSGNDDNDQFQDGEVPANLKTGEGSRDARRRIERLRDLQRLRELVDDPDFDDLD